MYIMCFPVKDSDLTLGLMNENVERIQNWCLQNLLLVNPEQSQLMVYGTRQMVAKLPECFQLSLLARQKTYPKRIDKELRSNF